MGEDMWNRKLSFTVGKLHTGTAIIELSMEIPQKTKSRSTIQPSYELLGISPKGLISTDA